MNQHDRITLNDALIDANRALLWVTETRQESLTDEAIHECLAAYGRLLHYQGNLPLSKDESTNVQKVLDRLRECLGFNGVEV